MPRYPQSGRNDDPTQTDGDVTFVGVDQRVSPPSLAPGYLSDARNARFNEGKARTRGGLMVLPVCLGAGSTPFTEVYGWEVFSDPITGVEWWIVAADGGIWKTGDGRAAVAVPLPVTLTNATFAQLVQCFNVLILLRGDSNPPLVCTDLDTGFGPIPSVPSGTYTQPIPNSPYGVFWLNRLLLVNNRDGLGVSDVQDYTRWQPNTGSFRIQGGNNDRLVAVQPLGASTLVCLKDKSVLRVDGLDAGPTNATLRHVTNRYGCVAPRTVVDVGADLFWLSERGVVSLRQTSTDAIQATDQALSDPLLPTIQRINPRAVAEATAEQWDGKLYVAVPLDDARLYGPELVAQGYTADSTAIDASNDEVTADSAPSRYGGADGNLAINVTVGQRYLYTQGTRGLSLLNGATTLTGSGVFTAAANPVYLVPRNATLSTVCNDSLQRIKREHTNNAVLVYSFVNQAWAGIDEGPAVCIRQFKKITYRGIRRLAALCDDGFIRLYEEGTHDYVGATWTTPTVTVIVNQLVGAAPQSNLRVGNGDTVIYGAGGWVGATVALQQAALWTNAANTGYSPAATARWNSGNSTATQVARGIKFTSTDGNDVAISVNSNGLTPDNLAMRYASFQDQGNDWARVFFQQGDYVRQIPIVTELVTRGYAVRSADQKSYRWLNVELFTWNPKYGLALRNGSVGREVTVDSNSTRDRALSFIHGVAPRLADNSDGRHEEEGFQDYSLVLPEAGFYCGEGLVLSHSQAQTHRLPIGERAAYVQLRIVNQRGTIDVRGVQVEAGVGAVESGIQY
jgi:hypothetical protein